MKKFLKYSLLAVGSIVLLFGGAITYIFLTFDPNAYKPQLIKAVKERKHRTLKLDGDIKLTIYPSIGVSLEKISLSERKSQKEFAAIDAARVSLKLLPLLSKRVVVDEVALSGVKMTLVKHKDGTLNIDDLNGGGTPPPEEQQETSGIPVKLDISSVSVDKTMLQYRDEGTGAQYAVHDLYVKTGRIASGVPSPVELSVSVRGDKPKLDLVAQFNGALTLDLDKQQYRVADMSLKVKGEAAGVSNLDLSVTGDAGADLLVRKFDVQKLKFNVNGVQGQNAFDVALALPGVVSDGKTFKISDLSLDAAVKQPEQAFKVKLTTPVEGNIEAQQFNLPALKLSLNATGDNLPNKSVSSELGGSVRLDVKQQTVAVSLQGGLLQSKLKADAAVTGFDHPAIRFTADIDQLDADPYLPEKAEKAPATAGQGKEAPEQPFDLSGLRSLDIDGKLTLGALKVMNIKASQLRVDVKGKGGKVDVPLSLKLYDGSAKLDASIDARPSVPQFAVKGNLTGVNVGPMTKDAIDLDIVEGKGNIGLNLTTRGNRVSALKKGLNGTAGVNLGQGAVKGVNLAKLVQGIQKLSKETAKAETMGLSKDEKTEFSEFHANFKVTNGVAHNDDLSIKAPTLHVTGNGDIDIGNDRMNYTTKVTFSKQEGGGTGTLPVYLTGPFSDLKIKVDYAALVKDVVKQKVQAKVQEKREAIKEDARQKAQEKLKQGLKGLFK